MTRRRRLFLIIPGAILGIVLFTFIGGEAVKLLWNWLLPLLFGIRQITFWQALGLLMLCRMLFGGSGFLGGSGARSRRRIGERMSERWAAMTPEEREEMRKRLRARWGFGPTTGPSKEQ